MRSAGAISSGVGNVALELVPVADVFSCSGGRVIRECLIDCGGH
jgi:hypothetical protein